LEFRKQIFERFSIIFQQDTNGEDEERDINEPRTINGSKEEAAEKIKRKWNWMKIIDDLAGNDILKLEEVTNIPAITCLTYLSYKIEINGVD
jgi:hypothetical protein